MADFITAYRITKEHEGGYVNDRDDPGGETYKGVARSRNGYWAGWEIVDQLKGHIGFPKSLDGNQTLQKLVKEFYKDQYWDALNLDLVKDQAIANELFDTSVNMGVDFASVSLQKVLNVANRNERDYKDLIVDGKVGPKTISALNAHPSPSNILKALNAVQGYRYIEICLNNPTMEKYFNGWIKRA